MKLYAIITAAICMAFAVTHAFFSGNRSDSLANTDFKKRADAVVIGRVVSINREQDVEIYDSGHREYFFAYIATVAVGKVFKGDLHENQLLKVPIGFYSQYDRIDESQPTILSQLNTPFAYDLRINRVYLMALARAEHNSVVYWTPRSGHKSIYEIRNLRGKAHIRQPSAWRYPMMRNNAEWRFFATNSMPLHVFVSNYIESAASPYPGTKQSRESLDQGSP